MISITYLFLICCLVYSSGEEQRQEEVPSPPKDKPVLTDVAFFRYGDPLYVYPSKEDEQRPRLSSFQLSLPKNPTETNEIDRSEDERKQPLFFFTVDVPEGSTQKDLPKSGPYIEIRKKRSVVPETRTSGDVSILRRKRSYCHTCGGGFGGYSAYVPVTYQAYPVYPAYSYPVYGGYGGGGPCVTCGKGGFGGGGGTFSSSSSSSKSSSKSWSYGK